MQRFVLLASIALIAAYWTSTGLANLLARPFGSIEGVRYLALWMCAVAVGTTVVVAALLRGSGERFTDLGFRPTLPRRPPPAAALKAAAAAALGCLAALMFFSGRQAASNAAPSIFDALAREPNGTFWLAVIGVVGGGYREELTRAFCLTRFERVFGSTGLVSAVIVDSAVFGLSHRYQGNAAVVFTAIMGLGYAGIFLRRRRVIDAMIVHAAWNLSMLAAGS